MIYAEQPKSIGPTVEFISKRFHMQEPNYLIFGFQKSDSSIKYKNQVKILISMKFDIVDWKLDSIKKFQITFGYRQKSFWNVYDGAVSRPMYENDYSPSFYCSYQTMARALPIAFLGGYVHESNGNTDKLSRSWDRICSSMSLGNLESNQAFAQLDLWYPWGMEENPEIWKHYGIGELTIYYKPYNFFCCSIIWKIISDNFEFGFYGNPFYRTKTIKPTIYIQLYIGSGENMSDYKERHTCLRIGMATLL
jgi:phospholipase A1